MLAALEAIPRAAFVLIALSLGLIVLYVLNPPHTPCKSQEEVFKQKHTPFFFLDSSKKYQTRTGYEIAFNACKASNSAGGCLELFGRMTDLVQDLESASSSCLSPLSNKKEYKKAMLDVADLLVRIAWGSTPPKDQFEKNGWLDRSHLKLFCRLKDTISKGISVNQWDEFREKLLLELPGASEIGRAESWRLTILSVVCEQIQ